MTSLPPIMTTYNADRICNVAHVRGVGRNLVRQVGSRHDCPAFARGRAGESIIRSGHEAGWKYAVHVHETVRPERWFEGGQPQALRQKPNGDRPVGVGCRESSAGRDRLRRQPRRRCRCPKGCPRTHIPRRMGRRAPTGKPSIAPASAGAEGEGRPRKELMNSPGRLPKLTNRVIVRGPTRFPLRHHGAG